LTFALGLGEWVVGDGGYRDGSNFVIPKKFGPMWLRGMTEDATARHETINGRMKHFKILTSAYRHDVNMHEFTFVGIAQLMNIEMEVGGRPFDVYYNDTGFLEHMEFEAAHPGNDDNSSDGYYSGNDFSSSAVESDQENRVP